MLIGPDKPIDVIGQFSWNCRSLGGSELNLIADVASQSGLSNWTLGQWATYYSDPRRDKVRNVISLEVSDTPLSAQVQAPALVRYDPRRRPRSPLLSRAHARGFFLVGDLTGSRTFGHQRSENLLCTRLFKSTASCRSRSVGPYVPFPRLRRRSPRSRPIFSLLKDWHVDFAGSSVYYHVSSSPRFRVSIALD